MAEQIVNQKSLTVFLMQINKKAKMQDSNGNFYFIWQGLNRKEILPGQTA